MRQIIMFQTKTRQIQTKQKEEFSYDEGCATPEQIDQRGGRCLIPRIPKVMFGWGSEQPGVTGDVPAHCKIIELDGL